MKMKLILAGLLLLAFCCINVMAANNVVPPGGDIFIGEQNLNIMAGAGNASSVNLVWFAPGNDITKSAPSASRTVNPASLYVSPVDFGSYLGNWYLAGNLSGGSTPAFVVRDPSITVSVRDAQMNDITGQSVTQGTQVYFRVESNTYTARSRLGSTAFGVVKVQTPDGTIYQQLSPNFVLSPVDINSSLVVLGPWDTGAVSGSTKLYKSGTYSVWAEVSNGLNTIKDNYNVQGKTYSSKVAVSIASGTLSMQISKDAIVKGNDFTTTITGIANTQYHLFVKNINTNDVPPTIIANQQGVLNNNATNTVIETDSNGQRVVGWTTNADTKDKSWTIRVEKDTKSDEVTIRVNKGQMTIVAAGSGNYYLGQEIKFTGQNTETSTTYFFITGPNLPSSGGQLNDPRKSVVNNDVNTFASAEVLSDNSWEYKWQTQDVNIDSGSYTIYAVSKPTNKDNLGDAQYSSVSVTLRKPIITVSVPSLVAAGDKITITGTAGTAPNGVAAWVFGKNFVFYKTESVETDGTYSIEMSGGDTSNLYPGQYFVVVQHPMYNGKFDTWPNGELTEVYGTYPVDGNLLFRIGGAGSLQADSAANALEEAIDAGANDDIYAKTQFTVGQPYINLDHISQKMVGDTFKVVGKTNLALDSEVQIDIVSSSFKPESKTSSSEFSGQSGTVKVVASPDSTVNQFTFDGSTEKFKPDEYIVQASSVTTNAYGSVLFTVVPYVAPTPTPVPTPVPTVVVTTVPTTTNATPIPTTVIPTAKSPGFGSVIALVGLGAVALLVTRKH